MDVTVIVAASTTSTRDLSSYPSIGALATAVAEEHDVAGDVFTLKVDGQVKDPTVPTTGITSDHVLELIEYVEDPLFADAADPEVSGDGSGTALPPITDTGDAETTEG